MREGNNQNQFHVEFSADFLDENGSLVFPDIGLSVLDGIPGLSYEFLKEYRPEYRPEQLHDFDVVISLKPRLTAASLEGVERLCAFGRCGVGYDNVDLAACTNKDIAVFITPTAVVRPVVESIVLFVLVLSHNGHEGQDAAAGTVDREHPSSGNGTTTSRPGHYRPRQHREGVDPSFTSIRARAGSRI
jgi:hypothetical protein